MMQAKFLLQDTPQMCRDLEGGSSGNDTDTVSGRAVFSV